MTASILGAAAVEITLWNFAHRDAGGSELERARWDARGVRVRAALQACDLKKIESLNMAHKSLGRWSWVGETPGGG